MSHAEIVTDPIAVRIKVTQSQRVAVEEATRQFLIESGIPLPQNVAHQVAQLCGNLSLNNPDGFVRPHLAWLVKKLGRSRRQIQRANKMLEEIGFFEKVGTFARRVVRRVTAAVRNAAFPSKKPEPIAPSEPAESAPPKGDMASPPRVTWGRTTNASPYSFRASDKPTPTPPPFVPSTATGSNAEVRAASKAAVAAVIAAARRKKVAANG